MSNLSVKIGADYRTSGHPDKLLRKLTVRVTEMVSRDDGTYEVEDLATGEVHTMNAAWLKKV